MDLRDPIWQGIGAVVGILSAAFGATFALIHFFWPAFEKRAREWLRRIPATSILLMMGTLVLGLLIGISIQQMIGQRCALPNTANIHEHLGFEVGIDDWDLRICNTDPCNWFLATERLSWGETSFAGQRSLEVAAEMTDVAQFYSIQRHWDTSVIIDGVAARVYVPPSQADPDLPAATQLNLVVAPSSSELGRVEWPLSSLDVEDPGWYYTTLDLRHVFDDEGNPFSTLPVNGLHVDLIVRASPSQRAEELTFLVDDVELFASLSSIE